MDSHMLEFVLNLSCFYFIFIFSLLCRLALDFQSIIQQWFETAETVKNWTIEEDVLQDGLEKKDWDLLDIEDMTDPAESKMQLNKEVVDYWITRDSFS